MNIKITEQNLRFKITEEELAALLSGKIVKTKIKLLDKSFIVAIKPQESGDAIKTEFLFESNTAFLNLFTPSAEIQKLFDMGRNRKGLEQKIGDVFINIQVDIRSDSRRK